MCTRTRRYKHVYVPLVPSSLLDLLDAPTPYLMGVGGETGAAFSAELVLEQAEARAASASASSSISGGEAGPASLARDGLVVVDLDRYDSALRSEGHQSCVCVTQHVREGLQHRLG
jgi:hypothetical protein